VIDRCTQSGMNDYIPKPFTPGELQEILIRHTGKKTDAKKVATHHFENKKGNPSADFDLTYLIQVSNHDRSFITQILQSFISNAKTTVGLIRKYLKNGDTESILQLIHKIKPSLTMIGAESARNTVILIEELKAERSSKTKIKTAARQLCDLLEKIIKDVSALDIQKV